MRLPLPALLLAACILPVAPAAAQDRQELWAMVDELAAEAASCPSAILPPGVRRHERRMHAPQAHNLVIPQLELMLAADSAACPGIAASAAARVRAVVGEPERPGVDLAFVALARRAAEEGLGMPRDLALADRYGRVEWLFAYDNPPALPRWPEAARQAWLERPENIALLEGRLAANPYAMFRQARMLGELRLRRDLPGYDPEQALSLFARAMDDVRYAAVLTRGEHMPPDYRRAFGIYLVPTMFAIFDDEERELLAMGRQAAAAARTPAERAQALRILFAASVNGIDDSCRRLAAQRRLFDDAPLVPVASGEAERIHSRLANEFDALYVADEPAQPRPIVLRGLIDPDGRLIYADVRQSSGSRDRDQAAVEAWAEYTEDVDLSATARGRFVWTLLPPIAPDRATPAPSGSSPQPSCL